MERKVYQIRSENRIVDLNAKRIQRQQADLKAEQQELPAEQEMQCENGVCAILWKPKRPAA